MSYEPGQVQRPILITLDGSDFEIVRRTDYNKEGIAYSKLWLGPFQSTLAKIDMKEDELDTSFDSSGVFTMEYKTSLIIPLTDNPERPISLLAADWNGNPINYDHPELFPIIKMVQKIKQLEELIALQRLEIDEYIRHFRGIVSRDRSRRNQLKEVFGMNDNAIRMPDPAIIRPPDIKMSEEKG